MSILILGELSCKKDEQECYVPKSVFAQVGFYVKFPHIYTDSLGRDSIVMEIKDTSLFFPTMLSLGVDSPVKFIGEHAVSGVGVLFNPGAESIQYRFQPDSTMALFDTLTFYYKHTTHFISNACGYTYYYTIDSMNSTQHIVDSFEVTTTEVTQNAQLDHVRLYFFN